METWIWCNLLGCELGTLVHQRWEYIKLQTHCFGQGVGLVPSDEATYQKLNIEIKEKKKLVINIPGANWVNIYFFMTISLVKMHVMSTSRWNKVSQQMEKKKKNYSSKRWHDQYFNEASGSKDMEYDWAQSAEWRYPKGIVLSPNSRVTGWAQIIMVKGVSLLMPKSVNDTLNTKVQCCGRHQVNPVGSLDEGEKWCEDDEDGGKKWWEARSDWCHQMEIFTSHLPCWFFKGKFPPFHSCFLPSPSLFHLHHCFFIFTSHRVDLVSPSNIELWCSSFHSLTLVSVMSLFWPWLFVLDL